MEAKDTIIKINEKNRRNTLQEKLLEQAEISFPLGKQEGVKEVMEWINKNITIPYPVGSYGYKLWQAKLESLIEEVK